MQGNDRILWRKDQGGGAGGAGPDELLSRFEPVLRHDSFETYRADSAATMTDNYNECCDLAMMNVLRDSEQTLLAAALPPEPDIRELSLGYLGSRSNRFDTADEFIDATNTYPEDAQRLHEDPRYANRIYARAVPSDTGGTVLQYWFFYYNNPKTYVGFGAHEGDWEMVQIHLGANDDPETATYAQHGNGERCDWDEVELSAGRPVVYVAEGSHASYFDDGYHFNDFGNDFADGLAPQVDDSVLVDIGDLEERDWLLWRGQWGGSQSSPSAPPYQGQKWDEPDAWAEGVDGCSLG